MIGKRKRESAAPTVPAPDKRFPDYRKVDPNAYNVDREVRDSAPMFEALGYVDLDKL